MRQILRKTLLVAVGAAASTMAVAAPTFERRPPPQAESASAAAANEAMAAYSRWMAGVQEIETPIQQTIISLSSEWSSLNWRASPAASAAAFQARLGELLVVIDRATARIEALETPDFAILDLPADLTTIAVQRDTIRLNAEFRNFVEAFDPLISAMLRRDLRAVLRANAGLFGSLRTLIDSQLLFARVSQAATDPETSSWHVIDVQRHFFRSLSRLLNAYPIDGVSGTDRALGRDLRAIAAEVEASAAAGTALLDGELADWREAAREAADDAERALFARNAADAMRIEGQTFDVGRRLSALLQETASAFERQPYSAADMAAATRPFQALRLDLDRIIAESLVALGRRD